MKRREPTQREKFHAAQDRLASALNKFNPNHDSIGRFAASASGIRTHGTRAVFHGAAIAHDVNRLRGSRNPAEISGLFDRIKVNLDGLWDAVKSAAPHVRDVYLQAKEAFDRLRSLYNRKVQKMSTFDDDNETVLTKQDIAELSGAITDLEARLEDLTKRLEAAERDEPQPIVVNKRSASGLTDFEKSVSEIRKRDNCSRTDALRKARTEAPDAFKEYNGA